MCNCSSAVGFKLFRKVTPLLKRPAYAFAMRNSRAEVNKRIKQRKAWLAKERKKALKLKLFKHKQFLRRKELLRKRQLGSKSK